MKRALLVFVLCALSPSSAPTKTLRFNGYSGVYTVTFDEGTYTDKQIKDLFQISPYEYFSVFVDIPNLEDCVPKEFRDYPCEAGNLNDTHFFATALVNLRLGGQRFGLLDSVMQSLGSPEELEPVISYVKKQLAFSLWLQQTRYDFYLSWDPDVLKRPYEGFNAMPFCGTVVSQVEKADSQEQEHKLTKHQWDSCWLHAYQVFKRPSAYPMDAWRRFLKAREIKEELEEYYDDGP
jgi:hypothetical protein